MKLSLEASELKSGNGRGNLRRRIVLAGAIAAVIGVAAYFLSQPRKGTVEWHKREYLKAHKAIHNDSRNVTLKALDKLMPVYARLREQGQSDPGHHRRVLVELGFMAEREYPVSRLVASSIVNRMRFARSSYTSSFLVMRFQTNLILVVTAPREEIPQWDRVVRQADVPETK